MIPVYTSRSDRHYVVQGNVNILQHLQLGHRSGASAKFFWNLPSFYGFSSNLRQLTSRSTTSCPTTWRSYRDHGLL